MASRAASSVCCGRPDTASPATACGAFCTTGTPAASVNGSARLRRGWPVDTIPALAVEGIVVVAAAAEDVEGRDSAGAVSAGVSAAADDACPVSAPPAKKSVNRLRVPDRAAAGDGMVGPVTDAAAPSEEVDESCCLPTSASDTLEVSGCSASRFCCRASLSASTCAVARLNADKSLSPASASSAENHAGASASLSSE